MAGRYPYVEPSRVSSREVGEAQIEAILGAGVTRFVCLQAELPPQEAGHGPRSLKCVDLEFVAPEDGGGAHGAKGELHRGLDEGRDARRGGRGGH